MSTTQRSESINSFFDKYLNKKTSLKQFVEQYENALRDRAEKENIEDFNSYNSWYPPITRYAMEEQMKGVLTNAKFKEFREELTGKMYCGVDVGRRYDKMCNAFSEVTDLASEIDEKCSLVLDRVNELKSEVLAGKTSSSCTMCTPHMSASTKDKDQMNDPVRVTGKGRPAGRINLTSEKIITKNQKKKKKLQDSDYIGREAEDNETTKKRSKKEKVGNKRHYFVPSDINHSGYASFPLQYGGFIPSYVMQHPQLQHLAVQMQQSSHLNSLNAAFNSPNTTFSHPTMTLDPGSNWFF
ncbi:FAR1-related sequence 5-like protein [Tanacetum coccineum]